MVLDPEFAFVLGLLGLCLRCWEEGKVLLKSIEVSFLVGFSGIVTLVVQVSDSAQWQGTTAFFQRPQSASTYVSQHHHHVASETSR